MIEQSMDQSPASLVLGGMSPSLLTDEELLTAYAEFIISSKDTLPPFAEVEKSLTARGLTKPVTLTLDLEDAVKLAYILDVLPTITPVMVEEDRLVDFSDNLYDVAMQLPYPFYVTTDGWRSRAAMSQGVAP